MSRLPIPRGQLLAQALCQGCRTLLIQMQRVDRQCPGMKQPVPHIDRRLASPQAAAYLESRAAQQRLVELDLEDRQALFVLSSLEKADHRHVGELIRDPPQVNSILLIVLVVRSAGEEPQRGQQGDNLLLRYLEGP